MQWSEMSAIQRKALTKKMFQAELAVREKVNCHLLVQYDAIKETVKVPFYTLKQIWSAAEFILENYEIQWLICGNFCVPDVDIAFIAFSKNGNLRCICQQYGKSDGLCPHVVVVAEKEVLLEIFISGYIETGGNINKVLNNTLENAGDKPKQNKTRRSRNNISKSPIIFVQGQPEPTAFDLEIDLPKRKLFTEYYQNNEKFDILFLNNPECDRGRSCISCKLAFPKNNPVVPDGQLVIMHKERYKKPINDSAGKFIRMTVTNHFGRKFYCINKECLLRRHPYFWRGMLVVKNATRRRLSSPHNFFLIRNFISVK